MTATTTKATRYPLPAGSKVLVVRASALQVGDTRREDGVGWWDVVTQPRPHPNNAGLVRFTIRWPGGHHEERIVPAAARTRVARRARCSRCGTGLQDETSVELGLCGRHYAQVEAARLGLGQ